MTTGDTTQARDRIRVGIAGWSYGDWRDWVYPAACKDTLAYVAPYVQVVEVNSSFYRMPEAVLSAAWERRLAAAAPEVAMTAKLHRRFTHEGATDAAELAAFVEGFRPLIDSGRLTALLAQFRYDFDHRSEHATRIARLREATASVVPLVVEVRHRSWQEPGGLAFLARLGVGVATLDYPTAPDSFAPDVCRVGPLHYLRMHGRNREAWFAAGAGRDAVYDYLYSPEELKGLAERARKLAEDGRGVIAIANNHYRGKELVNALELRAELERRRVPVPPLLVTRYPRLADIASN